MTNPNPVAETDFVNVLVSVTYQDGKYAVTCSPESVLIREPDTVINYQLVATDKRPIRLVGMKPEHDRYKELSGYIVSVSGKLLTFSDANTHKGSINITLEFEDEGNHRFFHDPQVLNDPPR
jgi:hypothetical protein